jgi:hypothetical protein
MREVPSGTVEAVKWLALLLMTGDHVNKFLYLGTLPALTEAGRLAFPLFAAVFAYNLARPEAVSRGIYKRVMARTALAGAIATVPYFALDAGYFPGGWWPLNVMFTLLVIAACARMLETRKAAGYIAAIAMVALVGRWPEFFLEGIGFGLAVWWYCKRPSIYPALAVAVCCLALRHTNGNLWALAALPVLIAAQYADLRVPRIRWVFYAFYPAHLAALWLIRIPMRAAGHIFI